MRRWELSSKSELTAEPRVAQWWSLWCISMLYDEWHVNSTAFLWMHDILVKIEHWEEVLRFFCWFCWLSSATKIKFLKIAMWGRENQEVVFQYGQGLTGVRGQSQGFFQQFCWTLLLLRPCAYFGHNIFVQAFTQEAGKVTGNAFLNQKFYMYVKGEGHHTTSWRVRACSCCQSDCLVT